MSLAAREKRNKAANIARVRKRSMEEGSEGPPDKTRDFSEGNLTFNGSTGAQQCRV